MNNYTTPDNWVIIEIDMDNNDKAYKVLCGWSGGYLDGDYWRINSGITKVEDINDHYLFHGQSGSIYKCYKDCERARMNIGGVLNTIERSDVSRVVKYIDISSNIKTNKSD